LWFWVGLVSAFGLACQPASFSPIEDKKEEDSATQESENVVAAIQNPEVVIAQDATLETAAPEELVVANPPSTPSAKPAPAPAPTTPPASNPDRPISGVLCSEGSGAVAVYLSHYVSTTTLCADSAAQSYWSKVYNDCFINKIAPGNGGSVPAVTVFTSSNCGTYVRNWITQWFTSAQYANERGNYRLAFSHTYCRPLGNGYYYVRQTTTCRHCPAAFNSSTGQCN